MADFCQLQLTCASTEEAQEIAGHLLEAKLIACAKFVPIESKFWWEGKIDSGKEVLVLMDTVASNFKTIEAEVAGLHSYETFVLLAVPITELSKDATVWLESTIDKNRG